MLVLELRFLCWAQVSAYSQCVGGVAAALGIGLQSAPATSRGAQFIARDLIEAYLLHVCEAGAESIKFTAKELNTVKLHCTK